jgi:hypothetical protein
MRKLSISTKSLLWVIVAAVVLALTSSCSADEYYIDTDRTSDCITDGYDVLEGEYASPNGAIVLYFNLNGTMGLRQNGILNGVSSYCFTLDGNYLKIINEFNQITYSLYSIVDTNNVKGIVLDGQFYELLNN